MRVYEIVVSSRSVGEGCLVMGGVGQGGGVVIKESGVREDVVVAIVVLRMMVGREAWCLRSREVRR